MTELALSSAKDAGMDEAALCRLDEAILADIAAEQCDGAAYIVARRGKVVRHKAVGSTDLTTGRAARLDDRYCLMSLSKALTAAKILQLVDHGTLSLATPIARIIPEFGGKGKDHVTIFHALTHTGGIWSGFSPPSPLTMADAMRLETFVPVICNMPLAYDPGSQVTYVPFASFSILGEVIARVDSERRGFRRILREDVFEPLGMVDTTYGIPVNEPQRVPMVQREAGPGGLADRDLLASFNTLINEDAELPGAGAYGTAADILRFAEMLRLGGSIGGARLLSPAIVHFALQNHTGSMRNTAWDYSRQMRGIPAYPANFALMGGYMRGEGFHLSPAGSMASPNAFAGLGGGSTMFLVDPERELSVVFLCAGLLEGLNHFIRSGRIADLAIAAVDN